MHIYSARAECMRDVLEVLRELSIAGVKSEVSIHAMTATGMPDVNCEFKMDLDQESFLNYIRKVEDSHVLLQTLRPCPLSENSLERDHDLR